MSLHQSIREEVKEVMKQQDKPRLRAIRAILAELTNELVRHNKKPQEQLPDQEVLTAINRLVKQRRDSITQYQQAERGELVKEEEEELQILLGYLPRQLSYQEILQAAEEKQQELGLSQPQEKGKLIGALMKDLQGQADGAEVKKAVEELLG